MRVEIVSIMAAMDGYESIVWAGDVPIGHTGHDGATNDLIYRYFNRVDSSDAVRLSEAGYRLPSLSPGDLIHWGERTWRIAGTGFELVTQTSATNAFVTAVGEVMFG